MNENQEVWDQDIPFIKNPIYSSTCSHNFVTGNSTSMPFDNLSRLQCWCIEDSDSDRVRGDRSCLQFANGK